MWDRWVNVKIDLRLLSESLRQFFADRNFHCIVEEKPVREYRVIAAPNRGVSDTSILDNVNVLVRGEPDGFKIGFFAGSSSRLFERVGGLATLFGGGIFLLRSLKSSEELEKLEKEFWRFVDEAVDHMSSRNP